MIKNNRVGPIGPLGPLCIGIIMLFISAMGCAALPLTLSIMPVPFNSNHIHLSVNDTVAITYHVTNNSSSTQRLSLQPITGVIQVTTATNNPCQSTFLLDPGATCSLNLQVIGSQLPLGTNDLGPTICVGYHQAYCTNPTPTNELLVTVGALAVSTPTLILAEQGILSTTSQSRILTIVNYAPYAVTNVNYTLSPTLPIGTTIWPTTCSTIQPGGACNLTITPGNSPSTLASATPMPLTPSVLTIQGDNTNVLTSNIIVLTYNNFYQQGFVFAIDDSTPMSGSVAIKVAASKDNTIPISSATMVWDNGSGSFAAGVSDGSTYPCLSSYDGSCNTSLITVGLNGSPEYLPGGSYVASLCANYQVDSNGNTPCHAGTMCYTDWYLPAICELGPDSGNMICAANTDNMLTNLNMLLSGCTGLSCFLNASFYWSSTEDSGNTAGAAWFQYVAPGVSGYQLSGGKGNANYVRCARAVT